MGILWKITRKAGDGVRKLSSKHRSELKLGVLGRDFSHSSRTRLPPTVTTFSGWMTIIAAPLSRVAAHKGTMQWLKEE